MNAAHDPAANRPPPTEVPSSASSFATLPLSAAMLANLEALGYRAMTPIQAASLPIALAGSDLVAQAKTGSGKTAAFALALLHHLEAHRRHVQALVLCPTRELADQVATEIRRIARAEENVKVLTLCGGAPIRAQFASLEHGAHVVVGTPGRILDHVRRGTLRLDGVRTLVLDEADRMLDMGFHDDIVAVVERCPLDRRTLLFSATYPDDIARLSRRFLRAPQVVRLEDRHAPTQIRQRFLMVDEADRFAAVTRLVLHHRPTRTLAFCNTKQRCRDLVEHARRAGISTAALHGDLEQRERERVLAQFVNKSRSMLVATDVAARGLDIDALEAVINVEPARDPEVHVHRIGRTGRVDAEGWAFTLIGPRETEHARRIEEYQRIVPEWLAWKDLEPASRDALVPPMVTLQIASGRKDKLRAGDVLGALTGDAGFRADQVGKIAVHDVMTYVAVDRRIGARAQRRLAEGKIKGRAVRVLLLDDADASR